MQQNNDLKRTSKLASEWLKTSKMKVLESLRRSLDLNLTEVLWHDLKQAVHARKLSNVSKKTLQFLL